MVVALAFAASVGTFAASASATSPDAQLQRGCTAMLGAVQRVVLHAATGHIETITSHLEAVTPGTLIGEIAFNATGTSIIFPADEAPANAGGSCGAASSGTGIPPGLGRTRIVATLRRTFMHTGRRVLKFKLNAAGDKILARVGAADRTYRKRHPHGFLAPSVTFGVELTYDTAG
jgi:hypothetical protein